MSNITYPVRQPWLSQDPRVYLMYTARARKLQSETIARGLRAAGRFLARTGTAAIRSIARTLHKRRTMAELSRLDDRLLADIGIDRKQIPMIAQGLIAPSNAAPRRTVRAAPCPTEYRGDAANDPKTPSVAA